MRLRVLVVDDAPDTRYIYSRYFQFRGAQATTAADGLEALQAVEIDPPDAIVLDLAMPRVTGWDVIRDLKANPATRDIPIVVLSGQESRESAMHAGADSYIEKPCAPEDLLSEVLRVLRKPGRPRREH
jgi:twitching motility two-component system response regulator PilH